MTTQSTENLIYRNEMLDMADYPLSTSPNLARVSKKLMVTLTCCWRSYIGTWEIDDNRLYLIKIDATFKDNTKVEMTDLFPDSPDRVFADWFSGQVVCNCGDLIDFDEQIYEEDLILTFKNGVLVKEKTINNAVNHKK